MGKLSTKSASHRYLSNFVGWIRAEPETEQRIREQAAEVRSRIKGKAIEDGIVVGSLRVVVIGGIDAYALPYKHSRDLKR